MIAHKIRSLKNVLGVGVLWAYVFAVLPCVLLVMDAVSSAGQGQGIALQLFLLGFFAPVALTALYITWYKVRHKK